MHETDESGEITEAAAFVQPQYVPSDNDTKEAMKALRAELGLPNREAYINSLSSFIVACKTARAKGSDLIAFPGDKNFYTNMLFGRDVAVKTRAALLEKDLLKLVKNSSKGQARVYQFDGVNLTGRFSSKISWPVRVRDKKHPAENKGRLFTHKESRIRLGKRYDDCEARVKSLNKFYSSHRLVSSDGIYWSEVYRVFNDGRLDRGGRLYGDWQQMKEEKRLQMQIDDEAVVEIDITACFLFIASALDGAPITSNDPYDSIPWVTDTRTRDIAKRLVASIIATGVPRTKFPFHFRAEFSIPKTESLSDYQNPLLDTFPVLRSLTTNGLNIMFRESEVIFKTIEDLMAEGIAAYPVHDCLIVNEKHWEDAARKLLCNLKAIFGKMPWLTVDFSNGTKKVVDPNQLLE